MKSLRICGIVLLGLLGANLQLYSQAAGGCASEFAFWLRADNGQNMSRDGVTDEILDWQSVSATSYSFQTPISISASGPIFIDDVVNGYGVARFDGSTALESDALIPLSNFYNSGIGGGKQTTIIIVANRNSGEELFKHDNSNDYYTIQATSQQLLGTTTSTHTMASTFEVFALTKSNTLIVPYVNGIAQTTTSSSTSGSTTDESLFLGMFSTGSGSGFNGDLAEILISNNGKDATKIRGYTTVLSLKYGIPFDDDGGAITSFATPASPTGLTIWSNSPCSKTGFTNDITGIGALDCSGLAHNVSHSVTSTEIVGIAYVGFTGDYDNPADIRTDVGDETFMLWGNNGVSNSSLITSELDDEAVTEGILSKLGRNWIISEKTGSNPIDQVVLRVDLSSALASLTTTLTTSDIYLLVDRDGDGLYGDQFVTADSWSQDTKTAEFTFDFEDCDKYSIGFNYGISALPIELYTFDVNRSGDEVLIEWSTLSERNNEKFEVLKSIDGVNWAIISEIHGRLFSESQIDYKLVDSHPEVNNFYRIKAVSIDGESTMSEIKSVSFVELYPLALRVFPNPVSDQMNLMAQFDYSQNINLVVKNQLGQDVSNQVIFVNQNRIDVSGLAKGFYFLTVTNGAKTESIRFIKS